MGIKVTKTLDNVTVEDYKNWYNKNCPNTACDECIFKHVKCNADGDDCWAEHPEIYSKAWLAQRIEIEESTPKLNEAEIYILENVMGYKYIVRDSDGDLVIFPTKPLRGQTMWLPDNSAGLHFPFPGLFQFIKWEHKEPYSIYDLLEGVEDDDEEKVWCQVED